MEATLVKCKIDETMTGKPCFITANQDTYSIAEWGQFIAVRFLPGADPRSIRQNNLYWACVELYREHKCDNPEYNTKEKCHVQIRWAIKYINRESAVHVVDKKGVSRLYFELESISFKTPQKKANQFYTEALEFIAGELGCTVDELVTEAESRMKERRICQNCGSTQNIQRHHLFSQTKHNRELYGKLIDHPDNVVDLCAACHLNSTVPKYTEAEFCRALGIEIRSKSGRGITC